MSRIAPEAVALLRRHSWPGNVRELENVVYRSAVVAQGDTILVKDLPAEIAGPGPASAEEAAPKSEAPTLAAALDTVFAQLRAGGEPLLPLLESEMLARALAADPDPAAAAKLLGLTKAARPKRAKKA